jgi:hypothetical protein
MMEILKESLSQLERRLSKIGYIRYEDTRKRRKWIVARNTISQVFYHVTSL